VSHRTLDALPDRRRSPEVLGLVSENISVRESASALEYSTARPSKTGPTRSDRSRWGTIGAYTVHAKHDPRLTTAPARKAFLGRFEAGLDQSLPPEERARRIAAARRLYFLRLADASARARRAKVRRSSSDSQPGGGVR
jgi:hypothetical protein